jgi:hypothetical protein
MPDDVRAEISPYFIERSVMMINSTEDRNVPESELYSCQRIAKLDDSAPFIRSGLAVSIRELGSYIKDYWTSLLVDAIQ